ncbi:hypothetical protein [Massilia sp. TSP1-1-2]|uniref:hypothetical protein n=1 Tax=Massilia sp. TSP1-1-2 TaxID=2804649 RepID=UPI003CF8142F
MKTSSTLLAGAALALLSACSGLQLHPSSPSDVTVHFVGIGGHTQFCTADGRYATEEFKDNGYRSIKLPVGKLITLWSSMSFAGYNVTSSCAPALAFIPVEGKQYVVNAGLVNGKCFIEMVREDASVESGVVFDTSVQKPSC